MKSIEALLQPFWGYIDLGMFADANDELENLPTEIKIHPEALLARLDLLVEMKKWDEGELLGASLCKLWPDKLEFWIKRAYCLHKLKRTTEAKQVLLSSPSSLHSKAICSYNLACYETVLGNIEPAKRLLRNCFKEDRNYREMSLDDPDLKPLWDSLEKL